jgi:hypothetical protein
MHCQNEQNGKCGKKAHNGGFRGEQSSDFS